MLTKRITESFSGYPVFTARDVAIAFPDASGSGIRQALHHMAASGRLHRVRNGRYSFRKDSLLSGFAYRPFYYGLLSSLTYRELWDQLARPCIMTTNTVKSTAATVFDDIIVEVHHVPKKYMFGFDTIPYGGIQMPVSDAEKTLIDFVYFKLRASDECYAALCRASSAERLSRYLKLYDSHTRTATLNTFARYAPKGAEGY